MPNDIALRDGNGTPSMLYEENGEVRRVSTVKPLPTVNIGGSDGLFDTATLEISGTLQQTLITPAPGKKLVIRGVAITPEVLSPGEAILRFSGGKVIHKVFRSDQSGNLIPTRIKGAVNETLVAETIGYGAGQQVFFIVNYQEE